MALKLLTASVTEPVALEEIQNFLRISDEPDVTILTDMISAARKRAETITRRQLKTATWELRLDAFMDVIRLPMAPLQSVTSVKYLDTSGVEQTLTENTDYIVDTYSEPARITPAYACVWPPTYSILHAVRIVFVAGYGDDDTDVPEPIRNWIKTFIGAMYENRETIFVSNITQGVNELTFLDGLLDDYRVWGADT